MRVVNLIIGLVLLTTIASAADFIAGADFSHLKFFEDRGILYQDGGVTQDGLEILKNHGVTCVRLRLFTSSAVQAAANPYNYINNLDYTVPLAVRVKNAGLQFMLDFHYSDTWADPAHQTKPVAWTNLDFVQLVQQMHDYNSNCIITFKAAGAMPDYVSVGNEITSGLLWPDGRVGGSFDTNWSNFGQLMKAAIQGIQDASGTEMPKIVVHIDRGGDWSTTQWYYDHLQAQSVTFDFIGESYYPFYHGPLSALSNCLTNAVRRYHKPVIVAETAFPWTNSFWTTNIYGIPGTTNGQVQYVVALAQVVKSVPGGMGAGVFWWGTEYQKANGVNEAGFNTASFFDSTGNVLPAAGAFGEMADPLVLGVNVDGPNLALSWSLSGASYSLKTTTDLPSPAVWTPVTNTILNIGTVFSVSLPMDASAARFYRLQSQ